MAPATLFQEMDNKVVGVQPLHHDDDGAFCLVVKPRKQGIAEPLLQMATSALRMGVLRLSGSSMMIRLPPRPVKVPPTEVASREPLAVVVTSASLSLAELIPRKKGRPYQRYTTGWS